jgi:hypothetical protein
VAPISIVDAMHQGCLAALARTKAFFCSMSMDHLHLHLLDTPATLWPAFGFEPRKTKQSLKTFLQGLKRFHLLKTTRH